MVEVVNTLNELGKCKFFKIYDNPKRDCRPDKTYIEFLRHQHPIPTKTSEKTPAKLSRIIVGKDWVGTKLPEGTGAIEVYDLDDGRQIIEYYYIGPPYDHRVEGVGLQFFANEFRAKGNTLKIEDVLPQNIK
jgi:hypothetical protein